MRKLHSTVVAMSKYMLRPGFTYEQACHLGSDYVLAHARTLWGLASVHLERLRHFKSVVRTATTEFWAILVFEQSWLKDAKESLQWFQTTLARSGQVNNFADWGAAVQFVKDRPQLWKRYIRRARQTALLSELWQAEVQHFEGLLFRACIQAGAFLPATLAASRDTEEVCGVCQRTFADLRTWSHHAFKVHKRRKPSRCIVGGTQCPVCLGQYRNNTKLCNHLAYSHRCRHALVNAKVSAVPEPGVGSRHFDDGHRCLLPATRAQGPRGQWDFTPCVDEAHAPCPSIIEQLEDLFISEGERCQSLDALQAEYRRIFASQCLQSTRLRATALQWQADLFEALDTEEFAIQWAAWHRHVSEVAVTADYSVWLGGGSESSQAVHATFRDDRVCLPWLDFELARIPCVSAAPNVGLVIGELCCPSLGAVDSMTTSFSHDDCIKEPTNISPAEWLSELSGRGSVYISCIDLSSIRLPETVSHFGKLKPDLQALRLYSDLVRCAFFLWAHGHPTRIVIPYEECAATDLLCRVAHAVSKESFGRVLSNFRS